MCVYLEIMFKYIDRVYVSKFVTMQTPSQRLCDSEFTLKFSQNNVWPFRRNKKNDLFQKLAVIKHPYLILCPLFPNTYTHARARAQKHAHTHIRSHTRTHMCVCVSVCVCVYMYATTIYIFSIDYRP